VCPNLARDRTKLYTTSTRRQLSLAVVLRDGACVDAAAGTG
jgi:hypothetical protein